MEGETDLSREATPTRFQDLSERERKKMVFFRERRGGGGGQKRRKGGQ